MQYIADFHIHSRYSHATSKYMDLLALATWGQLKGIKVMGTGDFTHPFWQAELQQQLQEAEPGLFILKDTYDQVVKERVYSVCRAEQRFLLSSEISTIFKRQGRCYKVHTIVLAPSFQAVEYISTQLAKRGNIEADGRPILGMDVKDLVKIALDASPDCMIIPAHIWTPHFGLFGSKSGFDSLYDCFQELSDHIYAIETGLSSNFMMNAQLHELDRFALLCNSDAHSVQKLGREANVMNTQLSYPAIIQALRDNNPEQLVAGIEFFPERGKYYADGHRACNVYTTPEETKRYDGNCPKCLRPMTIGVLHRVEQLATRTIEEAQKCVRKSLRVVPLLDIISQHLGYADTSKRVVTAYHTLLQHIGSEFYILLEAPLDLIAQHGGYGIAHAIKRLRSGEVTVTPGYDGVYGTVHVCS